MRAVRGFKQTPFNHKYLLNFEKHLVWSRFPLLTLHGKAPLFPKRVTYIGIITGSIEMFEIYLVSSSVTILIAGTNAFMGKVRPSISYINPPRFKNIHGLIVEHLLNTNFICT